MTSAQLLQGNCLYHLRAMPDESVHAVVTDPPYGLANTDPKHVIDALTRWAAGDREFIPEGKGFMGKAWDAFVPPPAVWDECMRVLKPGGHLLAFAGSRTFDLMTLSIRFAGFDIRDSIAWLYGSGFPKSMSVAKAIASGGGRPEDIRRMQMGDDYTPSGRGRVNYDHGGGSAMNGKPTVDVDLPAEAARWEGWGTALKPAFEPIVMARKPFPGTVAANVLEHGTGALNIDATRVGSENRTYKPKGIRPGAHNIVGDDWKPRTAAVSVQGRWPANVMLDESQAAELDRQAPSTGGSGKASGPSLTGASTSVARGKFGGVDSTPFYGGEMGGASRFFYVAKAPKSERPVVDGEAHPTVKPLTLMRQLIKLVTPPGGVVVDPFAGSGTTLEAACLEGFDSVGIEMTDSYWPLIQHRIERAKQAQSAKASADDGALFSWAETA
jgi:DNA modification methylase